MPYRKVALYLITLIFWDASQHIQALSSKEIFDRVTKPQPTISPHIVAGPPEPLLSLPNGASIQAFRSMIDGTRHNFEIQRLADNPHIFFLRGVLTGNECDDLISSTTSSMPAETVTPGDFSSRKNCQVSWLQNKWTASLAQSLGNLLLSHQVKTHPGSGVEDLQILDYGPGGEFILHHDGESRVVTILYYLNGVGATWFPLADDSRPCPQTKQEAMRLVEFENGLVVGGDNLSINRGDAIAFYNYLENGDYNWNSIHAGSPVQGETHKWVANHWFRYGEFQLERD